MILQSLVILLIGKILIFQQQKNIINNLKLDNEDIKLNILELKDDEKGSKSIIIRKKTLRICKKIRFSFELFKFRIRIRI